MERSEQQGTLATLNRREASKVIDNFVTLQEAEKRGLIIRKKPPESTSCQFCGKLLSPKGIVFGKEVFIWQPFLSRCDCKNSQKYWKQYDMLQEKKKKQEHEEKRRLDMRKQIEKLLGQSGIKKRFQQRTFPNFRTNTSERKSCFDIAKKYADNFEYHKEIGEGLYIEGTNGTGKTHLAAAIALQLINDGIPVICKTSTNLLLDIKKSFDNNSINESQVLDIYKKVDLLIIDDLGKEQCSDWSLSTLYSIINDRYEDMKPIIVTTNYNVDGLINALTAKGMDNSKILAIVSRLRETSQVMTMAWEDARMQEFK